jgi:hypothetical protein
MNWLKKKAFGWALNLLKAKIKSSSPEINALYYNFYSMSTNDFLAYCTNTLSGKDFNTLSFPSYIKEINNPMQDNIEEWIDTAIDGLDPRR